MDQEIAASLEVLKATPARLRSALQGVPRALALWTPAPGKWSILEIVCHMRDMERDAYQARYRRMLAEDNPALPDIDGDACALFGDYRAQKMADVLREWRQLRKENLALLRTVKGDAWQRPGVHETAGPLTVATLLHRHARGNDEAHLGQVEAIKQRYATLTALERTPKALRGTLRALPEEAVRRRTPAGKWSPLENACHLRDVERLFVERFTKMAHLDRPALWMFDNDRLAETLRYEAALPDAVVKEFARLRADTLTLLRALPHAAWQRTGRHPKRGEVTIEQMVRVLCEHDQSHLDRMRA